MRYIFTEKLSLGVLRNMASKKIVYPNLIRWCLDKILEMNEYIHIKLKSDTYREEKRMGEPFFIAYIAKDVQAVDLPVQQLHWNNQN